MSLINQPESEGISFIKMMKIEIIVKGDKESFVAEILKDAHTTGYTLVRNVSGMGHSGFHEGRLLFNDQANLVMFLAVAPEEVILQIAQGMKALFEKHSGVMFVSEVAITRFNYFSG